MKAILEAIYNKLDTLENRPASIELSASDRTALARQAANQAAGLLGAFGQTPLGQSGADPYVVPVGTGAGTLTSVTITAGTNLTGGGTISGASGTVTVNLSANPSVTTVDASTSYKVAGTKVLGAQGAAVADATGAGDVVAQLNSLLARCRAHGFIAT